MRDGAIQGDNVMSEPVLIRCRENGPLVVQGDVRVVDHLGNEFVVPPGKAVVALCRCGNSACKPFCDGSHRQAGFQAAQTAQLKPVL
jgi:CDGSH-type Zn-finger protein